MIKPKYIGLVGNPKSGKTFVQRILQDKFGYIPIDDGFPLREFAVKNLGLTWNQVLTQEGKAEYVEILGRKWQVREILGELGNKYEEMFGEFILPHIAMRRNTDEEYTSFGSVRKNQGKFIREHGGVIIHVNNILAKPSKYEFDRFNKNEVDYTLFNHYDESYSKGKDFDTEVLIRKIDIMAEKLGLK
jgi:hypothetical protein